MLSTSAKYVANIANKGKNPLDKNQKSILSDFKDVFLKSVVESRPVDANKFHNKSLMTVNGFIHSTDVIDGVFYIDNAVEPLMRSGGNHIGILSFDLLPINIDKRKITKEMIGKLEGYTMYEKVAIQFSEPVDGNFLVFAGYPIFEQEGFYERVSDSLFYLYPERLGYLDKIMELHNFYDIYKDLGVSVSGVDDNAAVYKELISDNSITLMLTRFNSFLCNFPEYLIGFEDLAMEYSSIPNHFRIEKYLFNNYPLFGANGKIIEYKAMDHNSVKKTILTVDAYYTNLRQSYKPEALISLTGKAKMIGDAYRLENCYMKKITFVKK